MTFVRANWHVGKDESLHILEGEADFIFFNEDGSIRDVVQLGDRSKGKNVFVRVPQGVFHTIIMRSEYLIIHEATPGPFNRADTLWADWSPLDSDPGGVAAYQKELEQHVAAFLAKRWYAGPALSQKGRQTPFFASIVMQRHEEISSQAT